jgi:hypothetical protein
MLLTSLVVELRDSALLSHGSLPLEGWQANRIIACSAFLGWLSCQTLQPHVEISELDKAVDDQRNARNLPAHCSSFLDLCIRVVHCVANFGVPQLF